MIRFLRIILITGQGFKKREIQVGASALVYYSLLALVPAIALMIGLARGFRLEDTITAWLVSRFGGQKTAALTIVEFAKTSLKEAQTGLIAGIGVLLLFWSAIKILRYIETVLNKIWEVDQPRSIAREFSDYLAMILICPFIILIASATTVYLSARVSAWDEHIPFFEWIGPLLFFILNFSPYVLTWILFTFIYIFMPNTRVRFVPALIAGIFTGTLYGIVQSLYVYFQIGVSKYNAIYGTFAAFPLFLIWLHLSWLIVLIGGKIAFAIQHVDAYEFVSEEVKLSQNFRVILTLRIVHKCIKRFCNELPPLTPIELSNTLSIPLILTTQILHRLVSDGILSEVKLGRERVSAFQPARPISRLTIKNIIDMINESGETIPLPPSRETEILLESLDEFGRIIEKSDANLPLKDI